MKTDKFEYTIRRKLESIEPEFHEDDWTKMQNYMHAHTPPTFWQQYSSWFGYAAAAAVTTVMVFLYVNQLSQNNTLLSDVKTLQNQIDVIKNTPAVVQKTDTVYIIRQQEALADLNKNNDISTGSHTGALAGHVERYGQAAANNPGHNPTAEKAVTNIAGSTKLNSANANNSISEPVQTNLGEYDNDGNTFANNSPADNQSPILVTSQKILDEKFDQLTVQSPARQIDYTAASRKMNYGLVHRMAPKQIKNVLLTANTPEIPEVGKSTKSVKKVKSAKKAETAIPRIHLKAPYRFGFAQQWEGKNQVRTALGEVLISKHFSVTTGVSWVKIRPANFHSEKIYNDRTRRNFKKDHYLPPVLKIVNMDIQSSLVQIPLNIAYRNDIKNNFAYYLSAGTNFTLQSRRDIVFDCYFDFPDPKLGPDEAYFREQTSEKMDLQLLNSVNFSAGIEKSWHPLVVQAEGYLYSYFTPLSPQVSRGGPGFKIKLLYQIGKKM
jgi:hypothetical protein